MWTKRYEEMHTIKEIEEYLNSIENFHDCRLGNIEYNQEKASAIFNVETTMDPAKTSEGLVWDFHFDEIEKLSFDVDAMLGFWIDEVIVENESTVLFALKAGYISISAKKIKLGIPSNQKPI